MRRISEDVEEDFSDLVSTGRACATNSYDGRFEGTHGWVLVGSILLSPDDWV